MKARGVLLPLRVLRDAEREKWRIVTGECRWRDVGVGELFTAGEARQADG
jgi:hypothetical protein